MNTRNDIKIPPHSGQHVSQKRRFEILLDFYHDVSYIFVRIIMF